MPTPGPCSALRACARSAPPQARVPRAGRGPRRSPGNAWSRQGLRWRHCASLSGPRLGDYLSFTKERPLNSSGSGPCLALSLAPIDASWLPRCLHAIVDGASPHRCPCTPACPTTAPLPPPAPRAFGARRRCCNVEYSAGSLANGEGEGEREREDEHEHEHEDEHEHEHEDEHEDEHEHEHEDEHEDEREDEDEDEGEDWSGQPSAPWTWPGPSGRPTRRRSRRARAGRQARANDAQPAPLKSKSGHRSRGPHHGCDTEAG